MFTKEDAIKYMREGGVVENSDGTLQRRILGGVHQTKNEGNSWGPGTESGMSVIPGYYRPAKEPEPAPKKPFTREDAVKHMENGGVVRWTVGVGHLGAWLRRIVGGVYMARYESNLEWKPTYVPMADGDDFYAPYYAGVSAKVVAVDEAKPASSWATDPGQNPLEDIRAALKPEPTGKKFDSGKPRMSLVPVGVLDALLRVDRERYGDSMLRVVDPKTRDVFEDLIDGDYADALYDVLCLLSGTTWLAGLLEVVAVLEHGCKKYDENNWQLVADAKRRYYDAAFRHLIAREGEGEERDPETGMKHLAHVGCNLVFLEFFKQKG